MAEFKHGNTIISVDHNIDQTDVAMLQAITILIDKSFQHKTTRVLGVAIIEAMTLYSRIVKELKAKDET